MIFGHLAVSALEHRYAKAAFVPVMAAAVMPDIVDKIAHYGFGQNESGRMWGHTLIGMLISSLVVLLFFGKVNAASWALGYISHLICDIGGVVPWFAPVVQYEFPPAMDFMTTLWTGLTNPLLFLEFGLTIWAVVALKPQLVQRIGMSLPGPGKRTHRSRDGRRGDDATV